MIERNGTNMDSRRSVLAVPAGDERKIQHASHVDADEVFFDLEDAVAPERKADARAAVQRVLASGAMPEVGKQRIAVRVNSVRSGYMAMDIRTVMDGPRVPDAIILPKYTCQEDIDCLESLLDPLDVGHRVHIEVLVETATGMNNVASLTGSRVDTLIFGPGDYSADVGAAPLLSLAEPTPIMSWAAGTIVNSAAVNDLYPIDGPYPLIDDEPGFRASCRAARASGFRAKWCIHPSQVPWANDEFASQPNELETARRIVLEYKKAVSRGIGAIRLDGRLVDEATVRRARIVLHRAESSVD